jgi:hypothetical protein
MYDERRPAAPGATGIPILDWEQEPDHAIVVRVETRPVPRGLGLLPWLSVIVSVGLATVTYAYNGARDEATWAPLVFWAGILLVFVPIAFRLIGAEAGPAERAGLVVLLGLGLYAVKVLYSPLHFDYPDELQHWRTANDIARTGHLFGDNPILPVSPFFPGLETATTALASLSGLTIFWSGTIVVGVARLTFGLATYLFFREVSGSARVAGIGALIYTGNPNFVYFNGQFAYESLGLPCAALVMYVLARRGRSVAGMAVGLTLALLLAMGSVVLTHHMTSYSLGIYLAIWTLCTFVVAIRDRGPVRLPRLRIGGSTVLLGVVALTWLLYVATLAIYYLSPQVTVGFNEFFRLLAGQSVGRELFRDATGQQAPLWERLVGYASAAIVMLGLPFGLRLVWRDHRASASVLAMALVALLYPATLPLRLTPLGVATAGRLPEFLFFGIGLVLALFAVDLLPAHRRSWLRLTALTASTTIVFMGGMLVGWGPPRRLPGPYLTAADVRGVDAEGIAASRWSPANIGSENRMSTDRINGLLMGSYGEQHVVTGLSDRRDFTPIFFAPDFSPFIESIIANGEIRYLVVDKRLSEGLPLTGIYYDTVEPDTFRHTKPMDIGALTKFDGARTIDRVYDSGDIVIYDTGQLLQAYGVVGDAR